ncbi:MAG: (2Fe-2S) ferredoxin domain-containing protein [Candidatus Bipolaricaulota bacterium]
MKLEELRKIRARVQDQLRLRGGAARVRIVVGMGTSGIAAGASQVLRSILDEVSRRELGDVVVGQTGEKGLASHEPVVEVYEGERVTVYGDVHPDLALRIVSEHVVNGRLLEEYVLEVREVDG